MSLNSNVAALILGLVIILLGSGIACFFQKSLFSKYRAKITDKNEEPENN